jgi:rubrerythrin
MHDLTVANLRNAYGGESMAHMRYRTWGEKAEQDGFPSTARLFRAITFAEQIHANNHFRELRDLVGGFGCNSGAIFGLGSTAQNLQGGIDGETFEINEMYPTYLETAKFQGEKGAERSFFYALSAEKTHAAFFQKAKASVDLGKDVKLGPMQICTVCGYTLEGDAPDRCPICGAKKEKFRTFA